MGCLNRGRKVEVLPDQKWIYISLNDFKSTSCLTPFAYAYLFFSLILSFAVYVVDILTAVSLLIFNTWSSSITPTQLISFDLSKWIFSICIILSLINLAFEHIRARRIMKRGYVAECYLDNLAVRLESLPFGKERGWKRFLVFAALTKSKKGPEYVALFTYISFQSWIRVIVCSGPRQVVNALTLLGVYNAKVSATGNNVESTLIDFFYKMKALFVQEPRQAVILIGMLFTLVVWVFSFLSLLLAFFFVFFLWGYIPSSDGGLAGYCSRITNNRLTRIVADKVDKALFDEDRRRKKAEYKAAMKTGERPATELKATIPDVGDDKLPEMPTLYRNDTMSTLPAYTSRPGTPGSFELGSLDQKRPAMPSRMGTSSSGFSAGAPLLSNAAEPGYARSASPAPSVPSLADGGSGGSSYSHARSGTMTSQRSFGAPTPLNRVNTGGSNFGDPPPLNRVNTGGSNFGGPPPLNRVNTGGSNFGGSNGGYSASPASYSTDRMPTVPQPARSPVGPGGFGRPPPRSASVDPYSNGQPNNGQPNNGQPSPVGSYRGNSNGGPYPTRSATNPVPPRGLQFPPNRNMTAPVHQSQLSGDSYDYFDRSPTSASQRGPGPRPGGYGNGNGWNGDPEAQRGPGPRY